jgi:RimJ/RimL family protein N-acetyltransferase
MVFSSLNVALYRTRDMDLVKQLSSHPDIFPHIGDDGSPKNPADKHYINSSNRYYLIPYIFLDDNPPIPMGLIVYYPINHVLYEGHIFIYPEYQHQMTVDVGHKANKWLFENSPAQKILAFVPTTKTHVLKLVQKAGFKQEGFIPKSISLNGQLIDQYIYTIGRDDYGNG